MMVNEHFASSVWVAIVVALWPLNSAYSQAPEVPSAEVRSLKGLGSTVSMPCVLLKNDNVLFGQAYQVGEYVVVRTGLGGEVQLRRRDVACWAASPRDLYRYRVDHRQRGDLAAHVRDARWCLRYDLYDLVSEEIRAIRAIDPENAEAKSIEDQLQRLAAPRVAHPSLSGAARSVQPAAYEDAVEESDQDFGSYDVATLRGFASHVQPLLLSRCGRCHDRDAENRTGWNLVVPPYGSRASSRMTRENLAASLPYIDQQNFGESKLLLKATTRHGGGPAPLGPRSAKAIESLKSWLAVASRSMATSEKSTANSNQPSDDRRQAASSPTSESAPFVAQRPGPTTKSAEPADGPDGPARLPQVANPFDPDLFNRRRVNADGAPVK